jgi:hypothetical protein
VTTPVESPLRKTLVVVDFLLVRGDGSSLDEYPRLAWYFDNLDAVPTIGQYTHMPRFVDARYSPMRVRVMRRNLTPPIEHDGLVRYFATLIVEEASESTSPDESSGLT